MTTFCPSATTSPEALGGTSVDCGAGTNIQPNQLGGRRPTLERSGGKVSPVSRCHARKFSSASFHGGKRGGFGPHGGQPGPRGISCDNCPVPGVRAGLELMTGGENMTTWFDCVATIQAPFGITNPLPKMLTWRGLPNGDRAAPGGPGGHALTGSIRNPRLP